MTLKVGLIGAGAISRPHLQAFVRHPQVTEVYVADPSPEAREAIAGEFGIINKTCQDHHELLQDDSLDLIDICTPHYLHAPQAIEAMQAGKHVIVEKPLAIALPECDAMMRVSRETGRRLFCALSQRNLPAHIKALELIREGEIGQPFMAFITVLGNEFERMNDPENWKGDWDKAGGGAFFDTGYHAVYVLQHFFGPAHAVTAMAKRLVVEPQNKADDTSVVALAMTEDVLCSIAVCYAARGDRWTEERRFVGAEGSILVRDDPEDEMPLIVFHDADMIPVRVHNPPAVNQYAIRETVSYFINCILEDTDSEITLEEARAAVATVTAAYDSERTGNRIQL